MGAPDRINILLKGNPQVVNEDNRAKEIGMDVLHLVDISATRTAIVFRVEKSQISAVAVASPADVVPLPGPVQGCQRRGRCNHEHPRQSQ